MLAGILMSHPKKPPTTRKRLALIVAGRNVLTLSFLLAAIRKIPRVPKERFGIIIAQYSDGRIRRFTINLRAAVATVAALIVVPGVWLLQSNMATRAKIESLELQNARLEVENSDYRTAAADLAQVLEPLQNGISDLSVRLDSSDTLSSAVQNIPTSANVLDLDSSPVESPDPKTTFNAINGLIEDIDKRLKIVRHGVAFREALIAATPTSWPADGWLSSTYGYREDPFSGEREFHSGIDIRTRQGQPVYATANGMISWANRSGAYGKMIEILHGFGLKTRYGHLAEYAVNIGDTVTRGDLIGYAGLTGRTSGYHVHYEVSVSGRTVNPLDLLAEPEGVFAN